MMQASSFTRPQEAKDYSIFRSNFLETFVGNDAHSLVKGINIAVDLMYKEIKTKDLHESLVEAITIAKDFVESLKDNGWMPI